MQWFCWCEAMLGTFELGWSNALIIEVSANGWADYKKFKYWRLDLLFGTVLFGKSRSVKTWAYFSSGYSVQKNESWIWKESVCCPVMMAIVGLLRWSSLVELVSDFLITYFAALTEQQRQHLSIMMLVQTETIFGLLINTPLAELICQNVIYWRSSSNKTVLHLSSCGCGKHFWHLAPKRLQAIISPPARPALLAQWQQSLNIPDVHKLPLLRQKMPAGENGRYGRSCFFHDPQNGTTLRLKFRQNWPAVLPGPGMKWLLSRTSWSAWKPGRQRACCPCKPTSQHLLACFGSVISYSGSWWTVVCPRQTGWHRGPATKQ